MPDAMNIGTNGFQPCDSRLSIRERIAAYLHESGLFTEGHRFDHRSLRIVVTNRRNRESTFTEMADQCLRGPEAITG